MSVPFIRIPRASLLSFRAWRRPVPNPVSHVVARSLVGALALFPLTARAAAPCEPEFNGGVVALSGATDASRLTKDDACTANVVKAVLARPALRGVTVTALATDDDLSNGKAMASARALQERLVAAGIPAALLASVALRVTDARATTYRLGYRDIPDMPVASVVSLQAETRAGPSADRMRTLQSGNLLRPGEYVESGAEGGFTLLFTDGHTLRALPGTVMQVLASNSTTGAPRAELLRGRVEVVGKGTLQKGLELKAGSGAAAVRGTSFRFTLQPDGVVRVETLEGAVDLTGTRTVPVKDRQGSRVFKGGATEDARMLLPPPMPTEGLQGPLAANAALAWSPVENARTYRVVLARDPDLMVARQEAVLPEQRWAPDASLPSGTWYWSVTAEDADGFAGVPSRIFTFTR
jgi:hypothetical protein